MFILFLFKKIRFKNKKNFKIEREKLYQTTRFKCFYKRWMPLCIKTHQEVQSSTQIYLNLQSAIFD